MSLHVRKIWPSWVALNWKLGLLLIIAVCIPRFVLVLQANAGGSYQYIGLIMIISAIIPIMLLNKSGLQEIGVRRPKNLGSIILAFIIGLALSSLLFYLGKLLYGTSYEN